VTDQNHLFKIADFHARSLFRYDNSVNTIVLTKKGWNYGLCLFSVTVCFLISHTISSPQIFSFQVPTVPPGNVQAEAVNSTTVRFMWSAPSPQFINGINQGYKVIVEREKDVSV